MITKDVIVVAHRNKECTLYLTGKINSFIAVVKIGINSDIWHYRLEHISEKVIKVLHAKDKLPGLKSLDLGFDEDFVLRKHKKISFSKVGRSPKSKRLELVHTDMWGLAQVPSLGGSFLLCYFIDDMTRKLWVLLSTSLIYLKTSKSRKPWLKMK